MAFGEGVGLGFAASPAAVRVTVDGGLDDPDREVGEGLFGSATGVSNEADEDVAVGGGWAPDRNCERMPEASLGETVVVVVVLAELAVTVTVTVTALGLSLLVELEVEDEVDVEEVDVEEVDVEEVLEVVVPLSEPVMPPLTPAALISPRTVLSVVQTIDVPGARISGMAKHCWVSGHIPFDVSNFPFTHVAMLPLRHAVS
jgi:hypothetical protein